MISYIIFYLNICYERDILEFLLQHQQIIYIIDGQESE